MISDLIVLAFYLFATGAAAWIAWWLSSWRAGGSGGRGRPFWWW